MSASALRIRILFALFTGLSACGGGNKPAGDPHASSSDEPSARHEESEESSAAEDEPSGAAEPAKAACDDDSCTPCGGALCPSGWYCDESASGGPACGWLPECAKRASCACVKRAFAGCACQEQGGAAHVRCEH